MNAAIALNISPGPFWIGWMLVDWAHARVHPNTFVNTNYGIVAGTNQPSETRRVFWPPDTVYAAWNVIQNLIFCPNFWWSNSYVARGPMDFDCIAGEKCRRQGQRRRKGIRCPKPPTAQHHWDLVPLLQVSSRSDENPAKKYSHLNMAKIHKVDAIISEGSDLHELSKAYHKNA